MDSYMARPRYAPRRPAAAQKRRKTPQSKGWLKRLIALQTFICIILLLMIVIIKGIHISATDFMSKQVDYVLSHNIELKSIFNYVENLAADVRKSITPGSAEKSGDEGIMAAEGSQASDSSMASDGSQPSAGTNGSGNIAGADTKTGSVDSEAALKTSLQDDLNAGSADTSVEFAKDTGETSAMSNGDYAADESGIGEALVHPQTSVLAASSDEAISELPEMTAPAYGSIDTPFGKISGGNSKANMHNGIDIGLKQGSSVVAAADGEVAEAGISPDYGAFIRITHKGGLQTLYAGCSGFTVQKGAKINRGDVVARIGNSAISIGYHLHFEVWKDGKPVNPLEYISVDGG